MQPLVNHLKYFFFIASNYHPMLAIYIIYDEIRGETKYKINTTAIVQTNKLNIQGIDTSNANEYMPSNYVLLERVFQELNTYQHNKTFLDIGCGKGRTLIVAAHYGFQNLTGVEFIAEHCHDAQNQIKTKEHQLSAAFHITCMDAARYLIPDAVQTIFFYNPFNESVMDKVIENILESLRKKRRRLFIIYLSPVYKQKFINAGFKEIYHTMRFNYLKASILSTGDEADLLQQ